MEIKDVFGAQPKSVWEYLCENGQGLYIPAYQRQYSWDKSKISRLIEDACHGFTMLVDHNDAITFIGTIIAIHDTELLTVAPLVKGEVPAKVMTIIDGQQRLTTLLLIITVLHEEIRLRSKKLGHEGEEKTWLYEECMKVISRLAKTYEEDKAFGDDVFQFYPRMIRSYDDSWSRKKVTACYQSPIGHYLHRYGSDVRNQPNRKFSYSPPIVGQNPELEAKYNLLKAGRAAIQKLVNSIAKNKIDDAQSLEFPDFSQITKSASFQNILLQAEFPVNVSQLLVSDENHAYKELTRIVLLANFILDRIAITIVTAKNEDYAFDMFESLNTTGEPLTAFETFKPRVIYSENLEDYRESDSFQYISVIESYLEGFSKTKEKQDSTSRLVIYFSLAESGEKLSLRLSDQRRFLRDSYENINEVQERREFVHHFSHVASFMKEIWKKKSEIPNISFSDDEELLLCLDVLRQLNHTITIGMMVRFYSKVRSAKHDDRKQAIINFIAVVKAITAFSILWRSSRKGTQAIDTIYRDLMNSGYPEVGLSPLARSKTNNLPEVALIKKAFVNILAEKGRVSTKEDWVKLASKIPSFTNHKEVTRFILLTAAHDSTSDKSEPGLTVKGKRGLLPLLNLSSWKGESSQTVEHIAPQTRSNNWSDDIYDDSDTINRLGNLTLLPQSENSSIGNASWNRKRLIYKILSAETNDELEPLLNKAKYEKIEISSSTSELLNRSMHLPMVRAISKVEDDWSLDLIDRRSIRIAELAWSRLFKWLK